MKQVICGVLAVAVLAACGGGGGASPAEMKRRAQGGHAGGTTTLIGAGASFPRPVYDRWFAEYAKGHPVRVNYQPIGSGGGIRQVTEGTVDFGASDAPMTDEELAKAPGMVHLPTVMGAVTVAYNLPRMAQPLRLDGPALAGIFGGRITRWNDPAIAALNPGVTLPATDVIPVYRTDGSGTTYIFTEYLAAVSPEWKRAVGAGKSVRWPRGLGGKGNEGVTGQVKQTPGAVGYVELAYAREGGLATASLRNAAGQFVQPTVEATAAAAENLGPLIQQHPDLRLSLVNLPGAATYPLASWTYLLLPPHMEDCRTARSIAALMRWSLTEGGGYARELHYAPLPEAVRVPVLRKLAAVTCGAAREPVGNG
ncbi:phosphate ABC transporter substrate-binding protein PstS [Longimicrobium terrae]|uniref:Phosphate-binding protein n=1 Tax=Longimicrobium terrae TaxID=1639882 RepID=A0A841H6W4_9BACT|nr:phosphate ABC transporter substrate-binding protein PstS [Longimicrobium terrae]MBB4639411.1 phosphate transport system substrate-binding protein [Longimicrobium terrae]MBB6073718.1 phosphate transport system substrate-binding protein [Longimicrobium terrae]NNC30662.1 phosphate ABC transporter substrate-binding protein PstS [Longimicrobium terrae]